jgi:hypothetical protein
MIRFPVPLRFDRVIDMDWDKWSTSAGMGDRHRLELASNIIGICI